MMLALLCGLLGAAAGSLVALAVARMPRYRPLLGSPCGCPNCGGPLPPAAHVPIAGPVLAGGTCPACRTPALRGKALIETATAVTFAFVGWRYGLSPTTAAFLWYGALFIAVFAIDLEHRLILNRMVYPAIALAPVTALLTGLSLSSSLLGGVVGFGAMLALFLLAHALFGPDAGALGMGDVKLGLFIGLITGVERVLTALLAFSLLAGAVSALLVLTRIKGRRDHIPYGPFMVLGTAVVLFGP